jgi:hypothetical protein
MSDNWPPVTRLSSAAIAPGCWTLTTPPDAIEKSFQSMMARCELCVMVVVDVVGVVMVALP